MSSVERRARAKENLRRAILDAARELFATEDYKAVSMRKIAEKIEYSPTAIYLHFKDKEEIVYHLIEEGFTLLIDLLDTITVTDPLERMREGARIYFQFAFENPHYYRLMFQLEDAELSERLMPNMVGGPRAFQFILDTVQQGIEMGLLRQPEPKELASELLATAIWAHIHGAVALGLSQHICIKLPEEAFPDFYKTVVDTTLHGILA